MKALNLLFKTDNDVSTLLLRLILGVVFFPHGAQMALGWFGGYGFSGTMGFFTGTLHIPAPFAFLAIAAQFAGAIALILGLFTRLAALGIGANMLGRRYGGRKFPSRNRDAPCNRITATRISPEALKTKRTAAPKFFGINSGCGCQH
jgi:uncharacterized membrane protein YphA (DoxX/SURF4 family)